VYECITTIRPHQFRSLHGWRCADTVYANACVFVLCLLQLKTKLGEGSFGEVWRAVHKQMDLEVAVKLITLTDLTDAAGT